MFGGSRQAGDADTGTRRELTLLVAYGFLVMLVIGLGATFATRSVAQQQALEESERMAEQLAEGLVKPLWRGYQSGDPASVAAFHREVDDRMSTGNLTQMAVWSADGVLLFTTNQEVGSMDRPDPEQFAAALRGETTGDLENAQPGVGPIRFAEVYTALDVDGHPRMLFEAHFRHEGVDQLANQLLRQTLPLVLLPLLALELVQIPIAVSLARRVKRHEHERSRLLERALSVSDRERVRFAADLHDGPIQDLAGITYALGAVAPTVPERHAPLMLRVQEALQRSIGSLRGLMTDLYPPDLGSGNLAETITALTNPLRDEGIDVQLDLAEVPALTDEVAASLYRVAREALANVHKHAQASAVRVSLDTTNDLHGTDQLWVRLVVADDGAGVDPSQLDRRAEGHLGLRLLVDRVESLDGELVVTSAVGEGTTVRAELPVKPTATDEQRGSHRR